MTSWLDTDPPIIKFIQHIHDYFNQGPFLGPANYTIVTSTGTATQPMPDMPVWDPSDEIDWESEVLDNTANIGYSNFISLYNALKPLTSIDQRSAILNACIPMFDDETIPSPHQKDVNFYQINGFADAFSQVGIFNRKTFKIDIDTRFTQCRGLFYICLSAMCQDYWLQYWIQWPELTEYIDSVLKEWNSAPKYDPQTFTGFDFVDTTEKEITRPDGTKVTVTVYALHHLNYPSQYAFWSNSTRAKKYQDQMKPRITRANEVVSDINQFPSKINAYKQLGLDASKRMSMALQFDNSKRQIGPIPEYNMLGTWELAEDYLSYFSINAFNGWGDFKEAASIEFPETEKPNSDTLILSMQDLIDGTTNKSILELIQAYADNPENVKAMLMRCIALERMGFFNSAKVIYDFLQKIISKYKWLS